MIPAALAALLATGSVHAQKASTFVACLPGTYQIQTGVGGIAATDNANCIYQCLNYYNFAYSFFQASNRFCQCSNTCPPPINYQPSVDGKGTCIESDYEGYLTSSDFSFQGCPSQFSSAQNRAIPNNNQVSDCFTICDGSPETVLYVPEYEDGMGNVYSGTCGCPKVTGGNVTVSDFGRCGLTTGYVYVRNEAPGSLPPGSTGPSSPAPSRRAKKRVNADGSLELEERAEPLSQTQEAFGLCPAGLTPCKSPMSSTGSVSFECLDVREELGSCGGCVHGVYDMFDKETLPSGVDCAALPGVPLGGVSCTEGQCVVDKCQNGWKLHEGLCEASTTK